MSVSVATVGSETTNGGIVVSTPQSKVKIGGFMMAVSGSVERRTLSVSRIDHARPKIMVGDKSMLQVGDQSLSGSVIVTGSQKVQSGSP